MAREDKFWDALADGPGVYPSTGGPVDLNEIKTFRGDDAAVVAPGLIVENLPADPADLATILGRFRKARS